MWRAWALPRVFLSDNYTGGGGTHWWPSLLTSPKRSRQKEGILNLWMAFWILCRSAVPILVVTNFWDQTSNFWHFRDFEAFRGLQIRSTLRIFLKVWVLKISCFSRMSNLLKLFWQFRCTHQSDDFFNSTVQPCSFDPESDFFLENNSPVTQDVPPIAWDCPLG
jgi:hypothetical protein